MLSYNVLTNLPRNSWKSTVPSVFSSTRLHILKEMEYYQYKAEVHFLILGLHSLCLPNTDNFFCESVFKKLCTPLIITFRNNFHDLQIKMIIGDWKAVFLKKVLQLITWYRTISVSINAKVCWGNCLPIICNLCPQDVLYLKRNDMILQKTSNTFNVSRAQTIYSLRSKMKKLTVDQAMTAGGETLFGEWSDTSQGCAPWKQQV